MPDLEGHEDGAHDTPESEDPEQYRGDEERVLIPGRLKQQVIDRVRHERHQPGDPDDHRRCGHRDATTAVVAARADVVPTNRDHIGGHGSAEVDVEADATLG